MEAAGQAVDIGQCPAALLSSQFIRAASPVIVFITFQHPEGISYPEWERAGRGRTTT